MKKRILSMVLTLVLLMGTCLTAIPSFQASASFQSGDVVTITEKDGGAIYPEGSPVLFGNDVAKYFASAMSATNSAQTAEYFAWCASYGVTD
ncbi:MAG: hypothetical protein IKK83_05280 [Clostridia bacterium]|nr:hypothetical protein [Clostridia bacterium]